MIQFYFNEHVLNFIRVGAPMYLLEEATPKTPPTYVKTKFLLIFIQNYTGFIKLDPDTYYVSELPFDFNLMTLLILNISVLLFCFMMLIIPSFIISKISPSESIKIK